MTATPQSDDRAKMKVINMLAVEGEDQVMLRVTVAEVQRSIMKQLGINLGAALTSGNFATTLLTSNALPLTAARGLGTLPIPGISDVRSPPATVCVGVICNWNHGPAERVFGNSGVTGGWGGANNSITHALRMLERDGLVRTLAEPNLTAVSGETAKFLAGGEYPMPVVDSQRRALGDIQGVRRRACVHADGPVRGPHQPEDRDRGQRAHRTQAP